MRSILFLLFLPAAAVHADPSVTTPQAPKFLMSAPDKEHEDGGKTVDSTLVTCAPAKIGRAPTGALTCHFRQLRVSRLRKDKTAPVLCTVAHAEWDVTFRKVGERRWQGEWSPAGACEVSRVHTLEYDAATRVWTYSRAAVVGSSDRELCGAGGGQEYTGTSYSTDPDNPYTFPAKDIDCARIITMIP